MKLPTTATTAATPDCNESPLKSRDIFVERDLNSGEIIVPDTPPSSTSHPEWAPRRVPLTMISNKQQQQGKRKLRFLDEEDEETIFVPSKKQHPYEGENSLLTPLLQQAAQEEEEVFDFIGLINKPTPKTWIPLRELEEHLPHPILSAREETNRHGCRILLKMGKASTKIECEIYILQRFAVIIPSTKIEKFN
ncbi:uncharacterized protein LOC120354633 [Nilaparvata lugens]|uniref:uncharacterized protein LOC120354633 n=1 Tax=Nilaparvata lugens TaxID=108931 RepID=UPI00193D1301|nr:uncharacterized protein LOC120354633 [Nilaparvata lugens]